MLSEQEQRKRELDESVRAGLAELPRWHREPMKAGPSTVLEFGLVIVAAVVALGFTWVICAAAQIAFP